MFAFQPGERRGRWSENPAFSIFVRRVEMLSQFETVRSNAAQVRPMNQQTRERHERRIRMVLPVLNFLVVEPVVILSAGMSQRVVIRMVSLNQDSAGPIAATSAPRDLSDQLKGPFC